MNINLNFGGVLGAVVCGGIAAAAIFPYADPANTSRGVYKLVIFAVIGGAFAGNFLWGLVFKPRDPTSTQPSFNPNDPR